LPLRRARITTFRCLREVELALDPQRNYAFGRNGAGKTSLLEAIFMLGRGRSFRTRQIRTLVQHGADGFAVFGEVDAHGIRRRLGVAYDRGRLEKRIDGEPAASMAELAPLLPVHSLDPSMHALIEGAPTERRRFVDWGVFHVEPGYLEVWKRYRRALSQRNAVLKRGAGPTELAPWTASLAAAGKAVDDSRRQYIGQLAPFLDEFGRRLLDRPLELDYRRGWADETALEAALAEAEARDREQGNTQPGPHRAEIVVRVAGRRVQDVASRGQQKLTAAALILAQVAVETAEGHPRSVLVIDDPAAELDAESLARLLEALADLRAQLVFTALTPEQLVPAPGFPVFHVERGVVRAL
jgi:DNA replication and repair protein RecF